MSDLIPGVSALECAQEQAALRELKSAHSILSAWLLDREEYLMPSNEAVLVLASFLVSNAVPPRVQRAMGTLVHYMTEVPS